MVRLPVSQHYVNGFIRRGRPREVPRTKLGHFKSGHYRISPRVDLGRTSVLPFNLQGRTRAGPSLTFSYAAHGPPTSVRHFGKLSAGSEPAYVRKADRASQNNGRCHLVGAHGHAPVPPCPLNTLKYESSYLKARRRTPRGQWNRADQTLRARCPTAASPYLVSPRPCPREQASPESVGPHSTGGCTGPPGVDAKAKE